MKVSIIIPAYNAAAYLERAIRSALRAGPQVQGGWEVILVDNNSTDTTAEIMQLFARRYPQYLLVTRATTQGPPAARNAGLQLARGEWVQFIDADDYIAPHKIAGQLAKVGPATEWVIGGYTNVYPDGTSYDSLPGADSWKGLVYNGGVGQTTANLYRRAALSRIGNWNERNPPIDDLELHARLLIHGAQPLVDESVGSYYVHHTGPRMTGGNRSAAHGLTAELFAGVNAHLFLHAPTYWRQHASFFTSALLRAIRIYATGDLAGATAAYTHYFSPPYPSWYVPPHYPILPRYTRLYPALGFRTLERSRLFLTHYLPPTLKQLLKA